MAMFFGARKPGVPELQAWRDIVARLPGLKEAAMSGGANGFGAVEIKASCACERLRAVQTEFYEGKLGFSRFPGRTTPWPYAPGMTLLFLQNFYVPPNTPAIS